MNCPNRNIRPLPLWLLPAVAAALLLPGCKLPEMPDLGLTDWYIYGSSDHKHDKLYGSLPGNRAAAARKLGENATKRSPEEQQRVVVELTQSIRTETDPLVRIAILETIAKYPVPLAGQVLRAGLRDESKDVKVACCEAWGQRGGGEAVEALSAAMSSESELDVRLAAARALADVREPGAIQALAVALEEKQDPALQHRAVQSLRAIGPRDLGNDLEKWRQYARNPQAPLPAGPSLAERLKWWE